MSLRVGVSVEIKRAEHLGDYRLELAFSDGHVAVIDFGPFLRSSLNPDTRRFLESKRFGKFSLVHGNLVWGDYEMCFPVEDLYKGDIGVYQPAGRVRAVAEPSAEYGVKKGGNRRARRS